MTWVAARIALGDDQAVGVVPGALLDAQLQVRGPPCLGVELRMPLGLPGFQMGPITLVVSEHIGGIRGASDPKTEALRNKSHGIAIMTRPMQTIHDKPKPRKWLRRLMWALGLLAVFVGVLEFTLRRKGYAQRATMYYDQDVGFRSWPNQQRWQLAREEKQPTVLMQLNGIGFRGLLLPKQHKQGVSRVLTLGDSYNFGLGVEDDETYPVQLGQVLEENGGGFEVMDISYPGWAPINEANAYRVLAREYKPDVVVLGFTFNDLQPPDSGVRYTDGIFFRLFGNSAIAWAITTTQLKRLPGYVIDPGEEALALQQAYWADNRNIQLGAASEKAKPFWEGPTKALTQLREDVRADGGELLVVYFPDRLQVDQLRELKAKGMDQDAESRSKISSMQEELARRCTELGIDYHDCTTALVDLPGTAFDGKDPQHPGPTGLRAIAEDIGRLLAD